MKPAALLPVALVLFGGCKKDDAKPGPAPAANVDAATAKAPPADAAPGKPAETFQLDNVMPDAWFDEGGGCARVLARIAGCSKDKAFLAALVVDLDDEDKKLQLESAARAGGWEKDPGNVCTQLPSVTYEEEGFLGDRWDQLAADDVLADCAKLGTAIQEAGGLPEGSTDS